jgi:hypothetical protein
MEKTGKNGDTYLGVDSEHIQRSKLRIDTRKWVAAKLAAKEVRRPLALEHSGTDGKPLIPPTDPEHASKLLADLVGRLGAIAGSGPSVVASRRRARS